jgi:hypothetical protein
VKLWSACGVTVLALCVAAVLVLRSDWFSGVVRERIAFEAGKATGGRVEIGSFHFDWRTLRVDLGELVIHGSEPSNGPPLLRVASVTFTLKLAPLLKGGKIRAIAVTSGSAHPAFPDLPPLASVAPGFAVAIWVGVFAPAGTPAPLVERLNQEMNAIAASPDLVPVLEPDGTLPEAISPAAFAGRLKDELGQWKQIATEHKIAAE